MAFLFFILFIITALFSTILIFSSKRLSPIPYFPSNKQDIPLIIKSLSLKNNQVVFDLGAGDGVVIFEAAKETYKKGLNTKLVAVEINLVLFLILHLRRLLHPNKENIKIIWGDFFKMNLKGTSFWRAKRVQNRSSKQRFRTPLRSSSFEGRASRNDNEAMKQFNNTTIYLYISPWFLDRVTYKILQEFPKASIVSYMYPIKSLKKKPHFAEASRGKEKIIRAKNQIYIY